MHFVHMCVFCQIYVNNNFLFCTIASSFVVLKLFYSSPTGGGEGGIVFVSEWKEKSYFCDILSNLLFNLCYREYRSKHNITHDHDAGTVYFRGMTNYQFVREESVGPETDTFFTVNVPVFVSIYLTCK